MKISKLLAMVLVLVMVLSLTACGGPNVDELSKNYDTFQEKFNNIATAAEDNGWVKSDDVYYSLETISQTMPQYADAIENPANYDQAAVDQMNQAMVELIAWADQLLPMVSVPFEG